MNDNKKSFSYTYSASQQKEIEAIRKKYVKDSEKLLCEDEKTDKTKKMETVRQLDRSVTKKAEFFSLCVGVISTLIMGFGMSLVMTDLCTVLRMSAEKALIVGIAVGFVGIFGVILAYPLYKLILKTARKKIAPKILKLTDELLGK